MIIWFKGKIAMETIKHTTTIILCIMLIGISFSMTAQNTVSISAGAAVDLTLVKPTEAGNPVLQVTDDSKWLNYHIVATNSTYSISAQLETALPAGLQLQIVAGTYQGTWGGSLNSPDRRGKNYTDNPAGDSPGTALPVVTLELWPQPIVSGIGTFDTGTGAYMGHKLTYTLSIANYSTVRATSSQVSVLYTITQP
jgi:hypothetical protein